MIVVDDRKILSLQPLKCHIFEDNNLLRWKQRHNLLLRPKVEYNYLDESGLFHREEDKYEVKEERP